LSKHENYIFLISKTLFFDVTKSREHWLKGNQSVLIPLISFWASWCFK